MTKRKQPARSSRISKELDNKSLTSSRMGNNMDTSCASRALPSRTLWKVAIGLVAMLSLAFVTLPTLMDKLTCPIKSGGFRMHWMCVIAKS